MTRKDFELIAKVLKDTKGSVEALLGWEVHERIALSLADALARVNERFDYERFIKACGWGGGRECGSCGGEHPDEGKDETMRVRERDRIPGCACVNCERGEGLCLGLIVADKGRRTMSETTPGRWTPGPWIVEYPDILGAQGGIAHVATVNRMLPREECEANAALIASAPDLARKLERAREALQGLFQHCAMIHKLWGSNSNQKESDAAIAQARALIAELDA